MKDNACLKQALSHGACIDLPGLFQHTGRK